MRQLVAGYIDCAPILIGVSGVFSGSCCNIGGGLSYNYD